MDKESIEALTDAIHRLCDILDSERALMEQEVRTIIIDKSSSLYEEIMKGYDEDKVN